MRWALPAWVLALLAAAPADAQETQEAQRLVEVAVTAVAGGGAYLDAGRSAGIAPGDEVRLFPSGGAPFAATVVAVSSSSARAALPSGATVGVGDRGEVLVPEARLASGEPAPAGRDAPVWTAPLAEWSRDLPLLAPVDAADREESPVELHGRLFASTDPLWDLAREQSSVLYRLGGSLMVRNPFSDGGELHLDGELFRRDAEFLDAPDTADERARLDRFSYVSGGTRESPARFEVGRFLQSEFPELGVLDGIEVVRRGGNDARFGASAGYMPEILSDFRTADDFQLALFYGSPREHRDLEWGVAYQNTWHRGDQDRNLLVGNVGYRRDGLFLGAEAWVDYYGASDVIKSSGLEVTELRLTGRGAFSRSTGGGIQLSRVRWPELLRDEFASLTPEQIRDNVTDRGSVDLWRQLSSVFRVDARATAWADQDDDGTSGEARVSARNWWDARSGMSLALFATDGAFSSSQGLRLTADETLALATLRALYEYTLFDQSGFLGTQRELAQHRGRLQLDAPFGRWSVSAYVETLQGDEQDSYGAGLFVQLTF